MATFTYPHDNGVSLAKKPRVLKAQFGDGYSQRVADGINNNPESWSLNFNSRTAAEKTAIMAFFDAHAGGLAFQWTSPSGLTGSFTCPEYGLTPKTAVANDLTARFEQVFDPL